MRTFGRLCGVALVGLSAVAFAPSANAIVLFDNYYGGLNNFNDPADVIGNSHYYVSSAFVGRTGNDLTVVINTNFVNHIDEDSAHVQLGALFLGNTANLDLVGGGTNFSNDTFTADPDRFSFAITPDGSPTFSSGSASVYALIGNGSDVQLSNVNGVTTSPGGGYYFRENQAVGVNGNAAQNGDGITAEWSVDGSAAATGTVGQLTFTIHDIFPYLSDSFTLAWTMTCANDVILASATANGNTPLVPIPATLPLFASGLGMVGWLAARRRKKLAAAAGR